MGFYVIPPKTSNQPIMPNVIDTSYSDIKQKPNLINIGKSEVKVDKPKAKK